MLHLYRTTGVREGRGGSEENMNHVFINRTYINYHLHRGIYVQAEQLYLILEWPYLIKTSFLPHQHHLIKV